MDNGIVVDEGKGRNFGKLRRVAAAADERAPARTLFDFASLDEAFPVADPGLEPFGSNILVQMRTPLTKTKGGIIVPDEARETDQWNTQVAKLISVGPVAFHNRDTMTLWPEGAWAKPGEYLRVPKYGGDRWWVESEGADKKSLFVVFNDLDMIGRVPEDKVLGMVSYIL